MAQIGLKYLICSKLTETDSAATYGTGLVMSKAIKVDLAIEINEGKLYADDQIVENIKEFKSGKLTLNGDHISYETQSLILGHTLQDIDSGPNKKMVAKGEDDGAFVGIGFYATTINGGVRKYRAIWFTKVKFGIPGESLETKGDAINFQTPTIEGTILTDITGTWKVEATFTSEAEAKAWLNELASIETSGGTSE